MICSQRVIPQRSACGIALSFYKKCIVFRESVEIDSALESEFAMKTNRKLTKFTAVLMAVLMILCAMAITGCDGEDKPKEKSKITETKKTPEQIAAEKKAKAEAEQKAREEAEKKAKEAAEKARLEAEEKAKQEQALIKQNADQKKYHIFIKKSAFTLYLLDDKNNVIKAYDCTLGKNPGQKQKRGDMKTPTGTFLVDEICDARSWTHDFGTTSVMARVR